MPEFQSAMRVMAAAFAVAITPPTKISPSEWGARNMVLVEGPRAGQKWDPSQAPYICDIIDTVFTGTHTKGTVRKSAQCGFTQGLTVVEGWIAVENPARTLHVLPTTSLAKAYNRDKLQPAINATPPVKRRVAAVSKSNSTLGSSVQYKAFPGGSIAIIGANSAADLQAHTIKFAICDEISQWPRDLDGQGSPMAMVDARQIAFHATRDYRKLQGGTPTIGGECVVTEEFEAGDQRYLRLPCPHCGERIRLEFGGFATEAGTGLRFNRRKPVDAHYIAQCCGSKIDHWQKRGMIEAAMDLPNYGFVAEITEPGRPPSWHIDAITSNFTTWDKIAETFIAAGDDPQKLKSFYNHWLGLAYEEKSDAPDWMSLYKRREDYQERVIPAECLLVTMGVDVQKRGLYVEIVGWTPDRRSFTLHAGYISAGTPEKPADTSDPDDPCWKRLTELHETPLPDAFGNMRRIDATGVDCRYNASVVYEWVRRHAGAYAIRTEDGWGRAALGVPTLVDFDWRGKRVKQGAQQWKAGSYNLKARFYAYLNREVEIDPQGNRVAPGGYCHFGNFLPEGYFRQITAEYVAPDKKGNRVWKQREDDNHWLDCRVISMALAFGAPVFDIGNRPESFWRELALGMGASEAFIETLLQGSPEPVGVAAAPDEPQQVEAAPAPVEDAGDNWSFGGTWL